MMKIILIITILFYSSNRVESLEIPLITNIQDMIGLAHDVGDIAAGNIPFKNFFSPAANPILPVLNKLDEIAEQIENLATKLDDLLASLISRLPLEDQINTDVRDLQEYISGIEETFEESLAYALNISLYDDDTLEDFVTYVTSPRTGNLLNILNKIMNIVVPKKTALARVGFLENMMQKRKIMTPLELCNPQISYQNRLLQIYNLLSITELRSFFMTSFGFRLKMELRGSKSLGEFKRAESAFVMRLDQYLVEFKKIMRLTSREIFLCDPESLTDESTYVEFEGLFTAFVINEYQKGEECSSGCSGLYGWGHNRCYSYDNNYCTDHPCQGYFGGCGWIGGDVDICEFSADSRKRYNWVRSYSNGWYGEWTPCNNGTYFEVRETIKAFYECDTCICGCEESFAASVAIRTFSLRPQISNITENKVVSDVKFTRKYNMIHIQIEESPLLPTGQLARNESSWVPLEKFLYISNITEGGFVQVKDGEYINMTRDVDFTFVRGDHKKLHLDDISAGPNYVLTGVKLGHGSEQYEVSGSGIRRSTSPIQLEIHVTPFNYASGELNPTEENPSMWLTALTQPQIPSAYAEERTVLASNGDYIYKSNNIVNPPHLKPNQYIVFKRSSIHSDAGQSTVPFMDSRPVAPNNTVAYDGLGLSYRGHEEYGGFVILKVLTLDATNYMDASMTDKQRNYYMKTYRQGPANTPPERKRGSRRKN